MKNSFNTGKTFKANVFPLILLTFFCLFAQFIYGVNIEVRPISIQFNYEDGYINDALEVLDENGDSFLYPDWDEFYGSHNFAYIKGQSNRKVKVQFSSNYTGTMNLIINLTVISGRGVGKICNLFIANYDGWECELDLSGSLPDSVGIHSFTWQWDIYAMPTVSSSYCAHETTTSTIHTYYTLLGTPLDPVAKPWTNVLDLACTWAANNTTEQQVLSNITTNAYSYFGQTKHYDPLETHTDVTIFYLSNFLSASKVDCMDMSAVVQVFTWMLGGTQTKVLVINNKQPYVEDFHYKKIKPIGLDWDENKLWSFHQVGWLDNVYDACIMLYNNVRVPVNEAVNGSYKDDLYLDINDSINYPWRPQTSSVFNFEDVQ